MRGRELAAIAGVSALPVTRHLKSSMRDASTQVALDAIADAGLETKDIDGLFMSPPGLSGPAGFMWSCTFAHHLGLRTSAQAMVDVRPTGLVLRGPLKKVTRRSRVALEGFLAQLEQDLCRVEPRRVRDRGLVRRDGNLEKRQRGSWLSLVQVF